VMVNFMCDACGAWNEMTSLLPLVCEICGGAHQLHAVSVGLEGQGEGGGMALAEEHGEGGGGSGTKLGGGGAGQGGHAGVEGRGTRGVEKATGGGARRAAAGDDGGAAQARNDRAVRRVGNSGGSGGGDWGNCEAGGVCAVLDVSLEGRQRDSGGGQVEEGGDASWSIFPAGSWHGRRGSRRVR